MPLSNSFVADPNEPLKENSTITFGSGFGVGSLMGLNWDDLDLNTAYTINESTWDFSSQLVFDLRREHHPRVGPARSRQAEADCWLPMWGQRLILAMKEEDKPQMNRLTPAVENLLAPACLRDSNSAGERQELALSQERSPLRA
jgi:hypothetical protein